MLPLFIASRDAVSDAARLIDAFGDEAVLHASDKAEHSRGCGNVRGFCHWRGVERLIAALSCDQAIGTVH